jgi:hypothetical protein
MFKVIISATTLLGRSIILPGILLLVTGLVMTGCSFLIKPSQLPAEHLVAPGEEETT